MQSLNGDGQHVFVQGDIGDSALVNGIFTKHQPRAIVSFATERYVNRIIYGPKVIIQTNIIGTFQLLEAMRAYRHKLQGSAKKNFNFLHVSSNEVIGSLAKYHPAFTETHRYEPNSPYSASKAASDHLVRAYRHTYGMPVLVRAVSKSKPHQKQSSPYRPAHYLCKPHAPRFRA